MMVIVNALLPVLMVIACGTIVARLGIITGDQWRGVEKIAYFVLFPAIIIHTVARTDFSTLPAFAMAATLLGSILITATIALVLRPVLERRFKVNGPRFTSVFQGAVRWNTFIGLALADEIMGPQGVALLAVAIVAMIPVLNITCVIVLSRYAHGSSPSPAKIATDLIRNPFIWSTALGLFLNITGFPLPEFAMTTLKILGSAALPIGIVCVGAGLNLAALRRPGPALASSAILKLAVMPLVAFSLSSLAGLQGAAYLVVMIAMSVPAASGSYLLARQMGGDANLMAEILTFETVLAGVTMPLVLLIAT
ncbi:AEC family transporter [Stappia sp. GBMRC 2046]|uniref:AEC family transporter n=1 Tax=Stappia sediminis TaxID=2692190 RepID=A0A7X3LSA4_9HYPH|nr:AEC family transporter [Stappia sediminis]MXN64166.1 AEC family transporter [Stappia sediminis]